LALSQHPDEHRPQHPILLAVDQQLGELATLRVAPELADPVGSLEVGERQYLGLLRLLRAVPIPLACEAISISGGVTGNGGVLEDPGGVLEDLESFSAFDPHRRA
jgi:hypothetical protein